jgi:transposase-like protein
MHGRFITFKRRLILMDKKDNLFKWLSDETLLDDWAGALIIKSDGKEEFYYSDSPDGDPKKLDLNPGELFYRALRREKDGDVRGLFKYKSDDLIQHLNAFKSFVFCCEPGNLLYDGYSDMYESQESVFLKLKTLLNQLRIAPPTPRADSHYFITYSVNLAALIAYEILHVYSVNKEFEECPYCNLWYVRKPKQSSSHCPDCKSFSKTKPEWNEYMKERRNFILEAKLLREEGVSLRNIIDKLDASAKNKSKDWTRSKTIEEKLDQLKEWEKKGFPIN